MGDEGIFATTAEVQRKVGANVSATSNAEAFINQYMTEVESLINCAARFNFSDVYATLNADIKGVLKMAASAAAAMMVINYSTSGMPKREAETRLDVLQNQYNLAMAELKDIEVKDFMEDES